MPLPRRIQQFSQKVEDIPQAVHIAESFRSLEIIGDIGSHYDKMEITHQQILDTYDIFEDCLRHTYRGDEKERIAQVRVRLAASTQSRSDNTI